MHVSLPSVERTPNRRRQGSCEPESPPPPDPASGLDTFDGTDRLHDREPVPVHPEVTDLSVLNLVPGAGSCFPMLSRRRDAPEIAEMRRVGADPDGDDVVLPNQVLDRHLHVWKRRDGRRRYLLQALVADELVDVRRIVLDERLLDEAADDRLVRLRHRTLPSS